MKQTICDMCKEVIEDEEVSVNIKNVDFSDTYNTHYDICEKCEDRLLNFINDEKQ